MAMWIAERLSAEGKRVGLLTRGYKGRSAAGEPGAESDEVQLMKTRLGDRVAFGVGPNRYANGRRLAKEGVDWFVLDDGFQHLRLARDADILLLDATNPFGGGHVLPAGNLREPRSAIARADVVVITRSEHSPAVEAIVRRYSVSPIFYARPRLEKICIWRGEYPGKEDEQLPQRKLFAFCGIGNPAAFVGNLRGWGFQVVGQRFFPDHYRYTAEDATIIEREARNVGAEGLICTEKDVFNLDHAKFAAFELHYCTISMGLDRGDDFLQEITARARH